jgi:hypothetical protein
MPPVSKIFTKRTLAVLLPFQKKPMSELNRLCETYPQILTQIRFILKLERFFKIVPILLIAGSKCVFLLDKKSKYL